MAINKANMAKVRTFNRYFPKGHPKEGQETFFVEKIWKSLDYKLSQSLYFYLESFNYDSELLLNFCNSIKSNSIDGKFHTIRAGKHFKDGDFFSPRVWSGKPYTSPQIQIAPDLEIKRVYDFRIEVEGDYICVFVDNYPFCQQAHRLCYFLTQKTIESKFPLNLRDIIVITLWREKHIHLYVYLP